MAQDKQIGLLEVETALDHQYSHVQIIKVFDDLSEAYSDFLNYPNSYHYQSLITYYLIDMSLAKKASFDNDEWKQYVIKSHNAKVILNQFEERIMYPYVIWQEDQKHTKHILEQFKTLEEAQKWFSAFKDRNEHYEYFLADLTEWIGQSIQEVKIYPYKNAKSSL